MSDVLFENEGWDDVQELKRLVVVVNDGAEGVTQPATDPAPGELPERLDRSIKLAQDEPSVYLGSFAKYVSDE